MGIHHTVHKPSLKSHRRVNCFLDQNEMCGNTFRNGRIVLNSMAWPSVDLQTDRILGKLNKQMLLPPVGLALSSHWRKFGPFLLVLTLKIDVSSTRKHSLPLLPCSWTVAKVRGEEIVRKTRAEHPRTPLVPRFNFESTWDVYTGISRGVFEEFAGAVIA